MPRPSLLGIVAATLLLSIGLNAVLLRVARNQYAKNLEQQVWPTGLLHPGVSSAPAHSVTEAPELLLLGDSRIAQWRITEIAPYRIINAGIPGATTAQVRLWTAPLSRTDRPQTVVVEAGINDLKLIGLRPDLATAIVENAFQNISEIAAYYRAEQVKMVILEVWPPNRQVGLLRRLVWSSSIAPAVDQLNARLRTLDRPAEGIRVVNLFGVAGLQAQPAVYADTFHLKQESYPVLTAALARELKQL